MSLMEETDPDFLQESPRPAAVVGEDVYVHLSSLTPQEVQLLDQFYQQLRPEYAAHVLQYETAKERARKSRSICAYCPQETSTIKALIRMQFFLKKFESEKHRQVAQ